MMSAGITFGGDKIASAQFTDGTSQDIRAGGLVQIGGGLIWESQDMPIAASLSVNYHVDDTSASNGSATFSRIPVEAIVYYTGVDKWRFGVGARFVNSAKFTAHIDGEDDTNVKFDNTTGALIEVGYKLSPKAWVNGRIVSEKYKPSGYDGFGNVKSLDGTHGGVNMLYEF